MEISNADSHASTSESKEMSESTARCPKSMSVIFQEAFMACPKEKVPSMQHISEYAKNKYGVVLVKNLQNVNCVLRSNREINLRTVPKNIHKITATQAQIKKKRKIK